MAHAIKRMGYNWDAVGAYYAGFSTSAKQAENVNGTPNGSSSHMTRSKRPQNIRGQITAREANPLI